MKSSLLVKISGITVGLFMGTSAWGELTGDGSRWPEWNKMPVLNKVEGLHRNGGQFVSGLTNKDSVLKICKGTKKLNLIDAEHHLKEISQPIEPFFLESDQTQFFHYEPGWLPGETYYRGSYRVDLSCYGWDGALPEPGTSIPVPDAECQTSPGTGCDQLCPATNEDLSQCEIPVINMEFNPESDLQYRDEGHLWKIQVGINHNYQGDSPLFCSFIVYLQAQKPGSTTMIEKQIKITNKKVQRDQRLSGDIETLKNSYKIKWNQTKVKGVCQRDRLPDPFETCHPGLRYECNYVN